MMTYDEAIQYLESIGKIGDIEKELSTDGWTVVALAESYKEREGPRSGDAQVRQPQADYPSQGKSAGIRSKPGIATGPSQFTTARYNQLADGEPHKLCGCRFESDLCYQLRDEDPHSTEAWSPTNNAP